MTTPEDTFATDPERAFAMQAASKVEGKKTGGAANLTNAGKGRPKGVPNKTTTQLKEAILEAAEKAGGEGKLVGYLQLQATENPTAFLSLLGKVLPMTVAGHDGGPMSITVVTGVPRDGDD